MQTSLSFILRVAVEGRPELAAWNLAVNGYSPRGLVVLARHPHSSGGRFGVRELYDVWRHARRHN